MKISVDKLYIALILILSFSICAQADLAERIDKIVGSQKTANYSIHIVKADSGRTIYDHQAKDMMIPASNMKAVTTAAALRYLGADFEYKTKVVLYRDTLVVLGSGDPLLGDRKTDEKYGRQSDWIFKDIAAALKRNRIKTVKDIVVDTSVFDDQRVHPRWPREQLNRWYACEISGLNYNNNCVDIIAKNVQGIALASTNPPTRFITLINNIESAPDGEDAIGSYRNAHPNKLTLTGNCNTKAVLYDVAIERPAGFFGFLLAEALASEGIKATGQLIEKPVETINGFKLLAVYTTRIEDCIIRCNKNSLGMAAESLLKTIAAKSNPDNKNGSWEKGCELIGKYLSELGLDDSQFYIDDGSGLSRQNELSANAITTVLQKQYRSRNWPLYRDSLAVGGIDGTLEKHFKNERYKGKILGKTGYIAGVKSLSGICITDKGDYIFSILGNNGPSRDAINRIAQAIIDESLGDTSIGPEPNQTDIEEETPGS